jgi:predicted ATPase
MKISIQNLGAVRQAEIDLSKRLTVFCGPNNSGKTYVSYIIYALTKSGLKYYRSDDVNNIIKELLNKRQFLKL